MFSGIRMHLRKHTPFRTALFMLLPSLLIASEAQIGPTTTWYATRGLTQVGAAEPMGSGRLSFSLLESWYRQQTARALAPDVDADILVGTGALSFGTNDFMDVFLGVSGYASRNYTADQPNGIGAVTGGMQAVLPLPAGSPLGIGGQAMIHGGTSMDQIDRNRYDGHDYFLTRTDFDFAGKLMQTLKVGTEELGFKLHLNEGAVTTLSGDLGPLLLLAAGIQANLHSVISVGVEINSRTSFEEVAMMDDPLWVTPSIQLRSPYYFNFVAGGDISLSKERDDFTQALEKYRVFGGLVFGYDLLAGRRSDAREKAQQDSVQRVQMEQKSRELQAKTDSLTARTRQDSLALAKAKEEEQRRAAMADSLARKAQQDSIALADTRKKLEEEKTKRTDAEKELLSTGLLLLDAVYFETGKTEISINSESYLRVIAKMLSKYPKLQIEVAGHTDNVGRVTTNMALSQARAESVRGFLINNSPDLAQRLAARGYGPSIPKAPNTSAAGRKVNRRVELQVINRDVLKEYN